MIEDTYSINAMVREVMNIMKIRAKDKPIQLITEMDDQTPLKLHGDKNRIRQIIINLMNNAIKFTDTGSVTLKVSFEMDRSSADRPKEPEGRLYISVIDTGRGIKKEDQSKLFEAFEQVDQRRNQGIEGTGLGLSICRLLVDLMQGRIWVKSEYEKGSQFQFYIHQKVIDASPCNFNKKRQQIPIKKAVQSFEAVEAKVLVVDDNRVNLKVAAGMLKRYGIVPVEVNSGMDAIEILKQDDRYDLVFMDHLMPDMDGIEAAGLIRKISEYCKEQLVIIALSANAVNGMEKQFIEADMNDFLAKPIENEKLAEILEKWLPNEKIRYV